jgi:hypothetical protein
VTENPTLTPVYALDQIPGTRATRKIVEALRGLVDGAGIASLTRRKLAELLGLAERTLTIRIGMLERLGFLVRYAKRFIFRFAAPAQSPSAAPSTPAERSDAETEAQALGAFLDGRIRAGAAPREADPSAGPMILAHARTLSVSGSTRGADVIQLARLMGEAYVRDAATPPLETANFPVHPKWIGPALDKVRRAVALEIVAERQRRQAMREARAQARDAAPAPDRAGFVDGLRSLLHRIAE